MYNIINDKVIHFIRKESAMATKLKRTMLTLLPEWEEELLNLKKEKFFNTTKSEMYQHLIGLGLKAECDNPNSTAKKKAR